MTNRLFHPDELAWLTDSQQWHFISAGSGNKKTATDCPEHRQWMARHSHSHSYPELLFALKGQSLLGFNNRIHLLQPATVCYFAARDTHDEGYRTEGQLRHLWIVILDNHYVAQVIEKHNRRKYRQAWRKVISPEQAGILPEIFVTRKEKDASQVQWANVLKSAITVLADSIVRCGKEPLADSAEDLHREVVAATCRHIEETAGREITLTALARIAGYSKFHFLRLFRQHTGLTVQQYIDHCRLKRLNELTAKGHSQRNIARILGFSHPAALSRWKKKASASPKKPLPRI